jgi:gluconate 5-dehydrogenase
MAKAAPQTTRRTTDSATPQVQTDATGLLEVGREAAKRMIARGRGGKIINIASLARPFPLYRREGRGQDAHALHGGGMGKHDIQANAIGPGYIATEMNRALIDG